MVGCKLEGIWHLDRPTESSFSNSSRGVSRSPGAQHSVLRTERPWDTRLTPPCAVPPVEPSVVLLPPFLLDEHQLLGMRSDGFIRTTESRTAVCDMVLDASGALVGGVADMDIVPMVSEQTVCWILRINDVARIGKCTFRRSSTVSARRIRRLL